MTHQDVSYKMLSCCVTVRLGEQTPRMIWFDLQTDKDFRVWRSSQTLRAWIVLLWCIKNKQSTALTLSQPTKSLKRRRNRQAVCSGELCHLLLNVLSESYQRNTTSFKTLKHFCIRKAPKDPDQKWTFKTHLKKKKLVVAGFTCKQCTVVTNIEQQDSSLCFSVWERKSLSCLQVRTFQPEEPNTKRKVLLKPNHKTNQPHESRDLLRVKWMQRH